MPALDRPDCECRRGGSHAREPKRYLADGQVLVTTIEGLGELKNRVIKEA